MLKTAVLDGTQELGLQQEILEPRGVDPDVALLDLREKRTKNGSAIINSA